VLPPPHVLDDGERELVLALVNDGHLIPRKLRGRKA
jgi:50S ribosomal protein L16 3-hydroxylase